MLPDTVCCIYSSSIYLAAWCLVRCALSLGDRCHAACPWCNFDEGLPCLSWLLCFLLGLLYWCRCTVASRICCHCCPFSVVVMLGSANKWDKGRPLGSRYWAGESNISDLLALQIPGGPFQTSNGSHAYSLREREAALLRADFGCAKCNCALAILSVRLHLAAASYCILLHLLTG
jgi:hypothetical protein